jgi:hypothetical protein
MPRSARALPTLLACAALLGACATTGPETVEALRAANPVRLGAAEMRALVPGARVVYTNPAGVGSVWWNRDDGSLSATRDRIGLAAVTGSGRWWLRADEGDPVYCTSITWQSGTSSWTEGTCHALWRVGETLYGASAYAPGTQRVARYRFQHPFGKPQAPQ